jgi:hypothetical protein
VVGASPVFGDEVRATGNATADLPPCGGDGRQARGGQRRAHAFENLPMTPTDDPAVRYFDAIAAALSGLEIFMRDDRSPLYRHGIVAKVAAAYISRLERSFACWRNRLGFMETFKISRAESGFPVFQNVLELENDRQAADQRFASIPTTDRAARGDGRLHPAPQGISRALQRSMAERLYLEDVKDGSTSSRPSSWRRRPRCRSIQRPCGPIISSTGAASTARPTCR